jgi:4-alpha-glucanotransferase
MNHLLKRSSGILLHPTSLPGPYGIGDLGTHAYQFVDYLVAAEQSIWQVLPLGPTGYGDSPYASFSSFAGNPMLISIDRLVEDGDLEWNDVTPHHEFNDDRVMYGPVIWWKSELLLKAADRFLSDASQSRRAAFAQFCQEQAWWLEDFALFMALKGHFEHQAQQSNAPNSMWNVYWDSDVKLREPLAMDHWRTKLAHQIAIRKVHQFYFFTQWIELKSYANERGVAIVGDLPIYVAADSADVWAAPKQFIVDDQCRPIRVAGVPPDYFSETGQRWGNPVYNWEAMKADGFSWWIKRFEGTRTLVDIIRVDHFRGFEAGWSIPAEEETAIHGVWVPAAGDDLFHEVRRKLGELPIIAEDLGLITPEVEALRVNHNFPGMKVLQFAFDSMDHGSTTFLPHNHEPASVVYTGTHDNDTTLGWYQKCSQATKQRIADYVGHDLHDPAWDFIRMALASVCRTAIVPMQDLLALDSSSRMNQPSVAGGNWSWRMSADYASQESAARLAHLTKLYQRSFQA